MLLRLAVAKKEINFLMKINQLSKIYHAKKITDNDVTSVLEVCNSNPLYYKYCPPKPTVDSIKEDMQALPPNKEQEDKFYIGFFSDSTLVAIMDLIVKYPDDVTAFIGFFMLNNVFQGKNIGSKIISDVFLHLKSIGYQYIKLGYVEGNCQAKSFWCKNGFLPTGIKDKHQNYTVVLMQKTL